MKLTFRQRLFLYFSLLFTVFTIGIAAFEYSREKSFRREALEEKLEIYTNIVQASLTENYTLDTKRVQIVLPSDLRITLIDAEGNVLYDNILPNFSEMENQSSLPEFSLAKEKGKGANIRKSSINKELYLYYAKKIENHYIRVALPYDLKLAQFLKSDNLFLFFLLLLFLISIFFIHKITAQFGKSIKRLRDFTVQSTGKNILFDNDEIGEIGKKIADNYRQLEDHKKSLMLEKQKLLQHLQISEEGICFISSTNHIEFHNSLFIQYIHQLTDNPNNPLAVILQEPNFDSLQQFLRKGEGNYFETQIKKHGKIFSLRTTVFKDESYEIILTDITRQEKTKRLKQEMTGNIAHELRTPITSIRAYLETVLEQHVLEEKKQYFIQQAYYQTLTLSEMIKDMSVIAKLEEAPHSFKLEKVNLENVLNGLKQEATEKLRQKNILMDWQLPADLTITGNPSLLTSIFRNLLENTIRYAGENIKVNISVFNEDDEYHYFSYYDTGIGVNNEIHLNRLFERFYRVQEGRTRDTGGSGLGLSIVKNAVLFHKGTIIAKNRKEGGLEFIFQLKK